MTDALPWIVLICAALGTGITALTSSGVGRMHHTDSRELRRAQCFKDVLSQHVNAMQPRHGGAAEAASETNGSPAGVPACSECGTSSTRL